MRILQFVPFVALLAVFAAILWTGLWHEHLDDYRSPCTVSWDYSGKTYCEMTPQAAKEEKANP